MVDKHRKKLQQEKEEVALAAVREAVPHVGIGVCVLALEGTSWEVDAAISLLRSFQTDKGPQLTAIQQVPQSNALTQEVPVCGFFAVTALHSHLTAGFASRPSSPVLSSAVAPRPSV